jgi:S1-C subfamily serine protease
MRLAPLAVLLIVGPAAAQPAQLSAEALTKVKATTCYIKVRVAGGMTSGSGFLVDKDDRYGWVASNDHVICPSTGKRKGEGQPMAVLRREVVFHSGTPQEWTAVAAVVARDPERDLGCLKFEIPKGKSLPEPVSLPGVKATETMPVYVCGYPFGSDLSEGNKNPEISIGPASVSSVRSDDRGLVQRVQINGALNPGNSGGPIVNSEGRLVGVAVTTIVGAGIGNAVPQYQVKEMMDGRLSEPVLLRTGTGVVGLSLLVDPYGKLKVGKSWIAPVGKADASKRTVPGVESLPGAKSYTPKPWQAAGGAPIVMSELVMNPALEVWLQATWTDGKGQPRKSVAVRSAAQSAGAGSLRPGGPSPGGDDDFGGLPPGFLDGLPGLPQSPTPPPGDGPRGLDPFRGDGEGSRPFGLPPLGKGPKRDGKRPAPQEPTPVEPAAPADSATLPPAEEEEIPVPKATAPTPPAVSEPPDRPPVAPAKPAEEGGISTGVVVVAVGLLLAAVVGAAIIGLAVMQTGSKPTKKKRKRPARDWDDDEDEDDDRPRRRR